MGDERKRNEESDNPLLKVKPIQEPIYYESTLDALEKISVKAIKTTTTTMQNKIIINFFQFKILDF